MNSLTGPPRYFVNSPAFHNSTFNCGLSKTDSWPYIDLMNHAICFPTVLALAGFALAAAADPAPDAASPAFQAIPFQAQPLPLSDVRLTGGPLGHAQELDAKYLLELEPDRMLYWLRVRAGLQGKTNGGYGGWDAGAGPTTDRPHRRALPFRHQLHVRRDRQS